MIKVEKWLADLSEKMQLTPRTGFALDLVLNEALINIINYAFEDSLQHQIIINLKQTSDELIVEIIDNGRPFNPLQNETPELAKSLEEASIGGRGILLLREYCSQMNYCYSEGKNRLFMTISKQTPT